MTRFFCVTRGSIAVNKSSLLLAHCFIAENKISVIEILFCRSVDGELPIQKRKLFAELLSGFRWVMRFRIRLPKIVNQTPDFLAGLEKLLKLAAPLSRDRSSD